MYKESFEDLRATNDMMTSESSTLSFKNAHMLFYESLIVRNLLKDIRGIQHQPLDPSDVTLEKAEDPGGAHKHFFDRDARPRTNFNYPKK